MADLVMPDGTTQCRGGDCNQLTCGVLWHQLWSTSTASSLLGSTLAFVFFVSLSLLLFISFRNHTIASTKHTTSHPTVLTTLHRYLLFSAFVWAVLSLVWYIFAVVSFIPHSRTVTICLVFVHALLQGLKIFIFTFTFLSVSTNQIGLASLRLSMFFALIWAIVISFCELLAFDMEAYWKWGPYFRAASSGSQTLLYTVLTIRYHLQGATAITLPKLNSLFQTTRKSFGPKSRSRVSPATKTAIKSARPSCDAESGYGALSRNNSNNININSNNSNSGGYHQGGGAVDGEPVLEAICYWRPLHPFGIMVLIYSCASFSTSLLLIFNRDQYSCTLGVETILLYSIFPFAFYKTLLADSKLCQNLFEREEGFLNLARVRLGQLKLGRVISGGSAGTVVEATYNGKRVCVKKYVVSCLPLENIRKFEMETSLLGRLNHPNVVKVIGICNDNPYLYLVMEYCAGGDLYSYIHNPVKVLDLRFALIFMKGIASALAYIHSKGIVHRDIKSLNILLDSQLRIQLADFELSHFTGTMGGNQSLEHAVGTLGWLSPELIYGVAPSETLHWLPAVLQGMFVGEGEQPSIFACDTYAFGVVMFELLTRKDPPLTDTKIKQLLEKSAESYFDPQNFEVVFTHDGTPVPQRLTRLLLQCVQISPARRPSLAFILREISEILESLDHSPDP